MTTPDASNGKPAVRPDRAHFSSGPCAKRPGWSPDNLKLESLGRSHRSKLGKARLKLAIDKTRASLMIPADYRVGIMPGSDTGAIEAAFWSMLGARPVDVFAFESFGEEKYNTLSFYERRLEAMLDILTEKGLIDREAFMQRVEAGLKQRAAGASTD